MSRSLNPPLTPALRRIISRATLLAAGALILALRAQAAGIEVRDDAGQVLRLAEPVRRIVSLSPAATESLFAIGAGPQVVGTSAYSDYPAEAKRVPRISDAFSLNREAVVRLAPDLAIVWGSGTPAQRVAELRALGVPIFVSEPRTPEDIASTLERFGTLTGHAPAAHHAAQALRERIAALRARYAKASPVEVFVQISTAPLMTVNAQHSLSEALGLCGARNVFADLPMLAAQIGQETVVARDPQLIVAIEPDNTAAAALAPWRRFGMLRAVRTNQLAAVTPDLLSRAAPSFADGVAALCAVVDRARNAPAARP